MLVRLRKAFLAVAAFLVVSTVVFPAGAADAESRAFDAADKSFRDGFYERAEKAFAAFVAKHPASPRVSLALLLESQSAAAQKKFQTAIDLLATNMAVAAGIADQFQFAIATNYFASGRFDAAATNFATLVAKHTNSSLRLEATVGEARARFELKQWGRVADLLQNPAGVFQDTASQAPTSSTVLQGRLLLAEALMKQRKFAAAEQVAASVPEAALTGESKWRREYLRAQAQFAAQQLDAALASASNLVSIAANTRQPPLEAAAVALQGEILEALDQPEAAIAAYQQNQRAGLPPERIREALFKIVELTIAQGQITNALARLQAFIAEHPNEAGSDVALLTLAELLLKQHQLMLASTNSLVTNAATAGTNLLIEALADADKVVRDFTNSAFAGKAQFVRGWALFAQSRAGDSLAAFATAAETLPWSEAQAVARFKVADLEFQTGEATNALRDYRRVITDYKSLRRVQSELVPRARYQMLQASLATRDIGAANEAMQDILREFPVNNFTERTLLLFGQVVDELGNPTKARELFSDFLMRFPDSLWRPEVELAIARTFERERNWSDAIAKYDAWVLAFPTNENLARAEFNRAVANYQAGRETNAFTLFTNFIIRFPTNLWAAQAQNWVGDFYYRARPEQPEQFAMAEANYQRVYENTNWAVPELSELRYSAKLKAGRAALMRLNFDDAVDYFTNMINDARCPEPLKARASFAYGDAVLRRPSTNGVEKYRAALPIYLQIPRFHATDPIVPMAWCAIANCYFELGTSLPPSDPQVPKCDTGLECALLCYAKATNHPAADFSARSEAEVGIGNVFRQQARVAQDAGRSADLLTAALDSYLNVVYRTENGEQPDAFWVKKAVLEAASIAESQRKWDRALKLYLRLRDMIPVPDPRLEKKIDNAREQEVLQRQ